MNKYRGEHNKFLHYLMAKDIVEQHEFCVINDTIYIWWEGKYVPDIQDKINLLGIKLDPSTTKTNRTEVYNTIVGFKSTFRKFAQVDPYKIAFMNGVLDLRTLDFYKDNLQDFAVCNRIPWNYNINVEAQPQVQEQIKRWADYDENVEALLYQLIGYPMLVNCNLRTMFLLHGSAQGGKTKFVEYIEHLYGVENYSTFDIDEVNRRFNKAQICGKLFNYSDDIDAGYIEKPNFLKRLISGVTTMQVENKGKDGYKAPFYAKLIMSMNDFPKIKLDSDITAWQSRFNIIHFKHKFDKNPKYDEWAEKTLRNPQAVSWLIQESVKAINKAVDKGEFCYYDDELFNKFIENINPILMKALQMTLDDWQEVYNVKKWYDEQKELNESRTSFNAFVKIFNGVSTDLEIHKTRTKNEKSGIYVTRFRVREKQQ